jgi:hypothetical protein
MYLVACNCDASLYSFTDSPVQLHGGLWYFQLPQIYMLAKSLGTSEDLWSEENVLGCLQL